MDSDDDDWLAEKGGNGKAGGYDSDADADVVIRVHAPKGVEVFARSPLPVGPLAGQWYEYEDLSDAQLAVRPKLSYEGREA